MNTIANGEVFEALVVGSEVCLSDIHSAHDSFAREVRPRNHRLDRGRAGVQRANPVHHDEWIAGSADGGRNAGRFQAGLPVDRIRRLS